jgi:hypothetical protein
LQYCTPTPDTVGGEETSQVPIAFGRGAGDVRNLTLDIGDASIETSAAGRYVSAVAWREGTELIVATTEGGSDLNSRSVGNGQQATMAYSLTDRLHLAYVSGGAIYYRATDSGAHPADAPVTRVGLGSRPFLIVGDDGWAHLLYVESGVVRHRVQGPDGWSVLETIASGSSVTAAFTYDGALVAVVKHADRVRIYRQDLPSAPWSERASYVPGDNILGTPQIDADGDWVYIAFITERLAPYSGEWPNFRPEYKPAAPWANRIHAGANAQQYFTRFAVHDAGVYQQVLVTGGFLTLTARGQAWSSDESCGPPLDASCNPTDMRMQIGIDPTGGLNPAAGSVVWSPPANPIDSYAPMSVSSPAQGPLATVYLKSNPVQPRSHNDIYWDNVTLTGGDLVNGDFELSFPQYNGVAELKVAEDWHPFYVEDGVMGTSEGRTIVRGAWSSDGGRSWSEHFEVVRNAHRGNGQSGKFSSDAYPVIALENEPDPAVVFFMNYEEGDPPPTQPDALRYGRPRIAICELGSTDCTGSPGELLLPSQATRPVIHLSVGVSPDRQRGLVLWDALQPGEEAKDVYVTSIRPQAMEQ